MTVPHHPPWGRTRGGERQGGGGGYNPGPKLQRNFGLRGQPQKETPNPTVPQTSGNNTSRCSDKGIVPAGAGGHPALAHKACFTSACCSAKQKRMVWTAHARSDRTLVLRSYGPARKPHGGRSAPQSQRERPSGIGGASVAVGPRNRIEIAAAKFGWGRGGGGSKQVETIGLAVNSQPPAVSG